MFSLPASFISWLWLNTYLSKRIKMLEKTAPAYAAMIHGNTDTEHFAALYFTYLGDMNQGFTASEMRNALQKTIDDVLNLQANAARRNVGNAPLANSLNICTSMCPDFTEIRYSISPLNHNLCSGWGEPNCTQVPQPSHRTTSVSLCVIHCGRIVEPQVPQG